MTAFRLCALATAASLALAGCAMNDTMADDSAMNDGMATAMATENPMVGGAAMYASKTIVENAMNSADHTTLVAAVKAAGLVDTLSGPGPFTVFAPTNAAFAKLPAGTVDTLVMPANKAMLTSILTYHVVPGTMTAADIKANAMAHGGYDLQALLYTLALHRWLRFRLGDGYDYARDVGGVRYLFCRGLATGEGVQAWQPAPALVHALDGLFAGGGA